MGFGILQWRSGETTTLAYSASRTSSASPFFFSSAMEITLTSRPAQRPVAPPRCLAGRYVPVASSLSHQKFFTDALRFSVGWKGASDTQYQCYFDLGAW